MLDSGLCERRRSTDQFDSTDQIQLNVNESDSGDIDIDIVLDSMLRLQRTELAAGAAQ